MEKLNQIEIFEIITRDFMIPAKKVAFVHDYHSLEHAMLILTRSGYTAIPVLDEQYQLVGLISIRNIMEAAIGLKEFEFEKLSERKISEVMITDMPKVKELDTLEKGIELLINYPFVCVEDEEKKFAGILTRQKVMKLQFSIAKKIKYQQNAEITG